LPSSAECAKDGITIVNTDFQHNDMRDTGSEEAKTSIQNMLDKFLAETDESSDVTPVATNSLRLVDPGPVPPYVPTGNQAKPAKLTQ
jgi:hypothetical protein